MDIQIVKSLQDADRAKGLTVVIDVLRAFTSVCYLFSNGAEKIISVADLNDAYVIKKNHPSYLLIGERKGIKPMDFNYGNSPAQLENIKFNKKTIIFTTSAGTQGIRKVLNTDEIITGAFVNAGAIVNYIQKRKPKNVTLLCTDDLYPENEDVMCANYLYSLLQGHPLSFKKIRAHMQTHPSADHFLHNPLTEWSKKDFDLCLRLDTFDFIVKTIKVEPTILKRI